MEPERATLRPENDDSKVANEIEAKLVEQILHHVAQVAPRGEFVISAPNELVVRSAIEKARGLLEETSLGGPVAQAQAGQYEILVDPKPSLKIPLRPDDIEHW